jgi:hypothetical protein
MTKIRPVGKLRGKMGGWDFEAELDGTLTWRARAPHIELWLQYECPPGPCVGDLYTRGRLMLMAGAEKLDGEYKFYEIPEEYRAAIPKEEPRRIVAREIETGEYFFSRLLGYTSEEWLKVKANRKRAIDPACLNWNDGIVRQIAESISIDGAFGNLSILADALEESGCTDAGIMSHCRQPGEHLWRCWVIETILNQPPEPRPQPNIEIVGGHQIYREHYRRLNPIKRAQVNREFVKVIENADFLPVSCRYLQISVGRYWLQFPDGRRLFVRFERNASPRRDASLKVTLACQVGNLPGLTPSKKRRQVQVAEREDEKHCSSRKQQRARTPKWEEEEDYDCHVAFRRRGEKRH